MISKKIISTLFVGTLMSGQAFSLDNENFTVTQVDVTKNLGVVWVDSSDKPLNKQPTCNGRRHSFVACELSDDFCKSMISLALAAKTTGGSVDFEFYGDGDKDQYKDGECIGSFAMGSRFRLSE